MPGRPPKGWIAQMEKEVSSGNPDYSKDQVDGTVYDIWHHKLSPAKKTEVIKRFESIKTKALDQNVFNNLKNEFKEEIKNKIIYDLRSQYDQGSQQDFQGMFEATFNNTFEDVVQNYQELIKNELDKAMNEIKTDVNNELNQQGFDKKTSKEDLNNSLHVYARTLYLYNAFRNLLHASELGLKEFKQEAVNFSAEDFNSLIETLNNLSNEYKNTNPEEIKKFNDFEQMTKTLNELKDDKVKEILPTPPNGVKPIEPVKPTNTNIPPIDNTKPIDPKAQEAYEAY